MKTTTADFRKNLAKVHRLAESGKVDRALAALEKMLTTWRDHPSLLVEKSRLIQLSEHGELAEAKRSLKRAIATDRVSLKPWIELGFYLLCIDDRAEDAEEKFDHAIDLGLRLLAEAVAGKIDALLDQALYSLPVGKSTEMAEVHQFAQILSRRYGKNAPWAIRDLRKKMAEIDERMRTGGKSERKGT